MALGLVRLGYAVRPPVLRKNDRPVPEVNALPGIVLNRATPQGLGGAWRPASEWIALAAAAGFDTRPYRYDTRDAELHGSWYEPPPIREVAEIRTVIVVNGAAVGQRVPAPLVEKCCVLSERTRTDLLGVQLAAINGSWFFAGATPTPDLSLGGEPLLDLLAQCLSRQ